MKVAQSREEFLLILNTFLPLNCDVAELGVLHGDFSKEILRIINPETLVLIDPFVTNEAKYKSGLTTAYSTEEDFQRLIMDFEKEIKSGEVILDRRFSYDAVSSYADGVFDFIYIDGSHLKDDVKKDLTDWLPKLKEGGLLCGHDHIDIPEFGVIQAVTEFMEEQNLEMVVLNEAGGDFALKRK